MLTELKKEVQKIIDLYEKSKSNEYKKKLRSASQKASQVSETKALEMLREAIVSSESKFDFLTNVNQARLMIKSDTSDLEQDLKNFLGKTAGITVPITSVQYQGVAGVHHFKEAFNKKIAHSLEGEEAEMVEYQRAEASRNNVLPLFPR